MVESNSFQQNENMPSENDALDINELAALNDDISNELIEQLQNKLTADANGFKSNDAELFEEVSSGEEKKNSTSNTPRINLDDSIDDNFIKKYKAKLNKQTSDVASETDSSVKLNAEIQSVSSIVATNDMPSINFEGAGIEDISGGNIVEKPATKEQISYNDSLDFLDENIKYSKYVIYIDPENTEFIESLTVKERKNLINKILREQDDIALTKRRLSLFQSIVKHVIISIVTIAIAIPVIYLTINTSLEATIDNHRRSQKIFKTLYREKGKIKIQSSIH